MSSTRGLALSGVAGAILAISLIGLAALTGGAAIVRSGGSTSTTTQPGNQNTSTSGVQSPTSGQLSILLTDPPHVPRGVTAVYASYSEIEVRGEGGGWVPMNSSGEVELLGTVNVGQTLTSAKIPQGNYDAVKLTITFAIVTFEGKNYSATVQGETLLVAIKGGELVSSTHSSATIIDIQPSIFNIGSQGSPDFVMRSVALAFPVPSNSVDQSMGREGNRFGLSGQSWWNDDRSQFNSTLEITSASLTANSLTVSLKNNGTQDIGVRLIVVTQASLVPLGYGDHTMPMEMFGSAVFLVFPNGTLVQFMPMLHTMMPMADSDMQTPFLQYLSQVGYNLTAGSTATLKYGGAIDLGFGSTLFTHPVVAGTSYWVTVIGDQTISSVEITST